MAGWLKEGWNRYKENAFTYAGLILVGAVVGVLPLILAISGLAEALHPVEAIRPDALYFFNAVVLLVLGVLFFVLVSIWTETAVYYGSLKGKIPFKEAAAGGLRYLPGMVAVKIAVGLVVGAVYLAVLLLFDLIGVEGLGTILATILAALVSLKFVTAEGRYMVSSSVAEALSGAFKGSVVDDFLVVIAVFLATLVGLVIGLILGLIPLIGPILGLLFDLFVLLPLTWSIYMVAVSDISQKG